MNRSPDQCKDFGDWLRQARRGAGFKNLWAFAQASGIKVEQLSDIELGRGRYAFYESDLRRLMKALPHIPADVFYVRAGMLPPDIRTSPASDEQILTLLAGFRSEVAQ